MKKDLEFIEMAANYKNTIIISYKDGERIRAHSIRGGDNDSVLSSLNFINKLRSRDIDACVSIIDQYGNVSNYVPLTDAIFSLCSTSVKEILVLKEEEANLRTLIDFFTMKTPTTVEYGKPNFQLDETDKFTKIQITVRGQSKHVDTLMNSIKFLFDNSL